uniref:Uncharacterized protein n=1 Tax=Cannabis sativa TaxID=3483 RepID=A0A803R8W3_CANSA
MAQPPPPALAPVPASASASAPAPDVSACFPTLPAVPRVSTSSREHLFIFKFEFLSCSLDYFSLHTYELMNY